MARFRKLIVKPGTYRIRDDNGPYSDEFGSYRLETISQDRIRQWAANFNRMKSLGYNLPAPWNHDLTAVPLEMASKAGARSDNNGGFWTDLQATHEGLYGVLEAPGDINDPNSPAGKIGQTVKEVSIYANRYNIGQEKFKDALLHVALVTHPVEPGQKNFEVVKEPGLALAMSNLVSEMTVMSNDDTSADNELGMLSNPNPSANLPGEVIKADDFPTLLQKLKNKGIVLPDDTTTSNLVERLLVAILQNPSPPPKTTDANANTRTPPSNSREQTPASVAMSQNATNATPPAAPTLDPAVIMSSQPYKDLAATTQLLANRLVEGEKANLANRIQALVTAGRCTKEYADTRLVPMLTGFTMSMDPAAPKHALAIAVETLESLPAPSAPGRANEGNARNAFLGTAMSQQGVEVPPPHGFLDGGEPMTSEESLKLANQFLSNVGLK